MNSAELIENYIYHPFPLWNSRVAILMVNYKWDSCLKNSFKDREDYSINGCIGNGETQKEKTFPIPELDNKIQLAFPTDNLCNFYEQHGLMPSLGNMSIDYTVDRVNRAMKVLDKIDLMKVFILDIVRSVQIIESENFDTDTSYSHPDIPFSIFFSLCEENSVISDLRIAESILHETMHLLLTLIENFIDLVVPDSTATFYSPWRDEQRPVRGVLHGMFVFKTIRDFYSMLFDISKASSDERRYIKHRIMEIEKEFLSLTDFPLSPGLTEKGKALSSQLLTQA